MIKIFKKQTTSKEVTVEEIHESFFTEVDKLLEEFEII